MSRADRPSRLAARSSGLWLAFAVSALAAGFGTAVATLMEHAALVLYGESLIGGSETGRLLLALAEALLIGVSIVVGAIVARLALIGAVEDRRGEIALRRLLGSSSSAERRRLLVGFSLVGVGGACLGWGLGVLAALAASELIAGIPDGLDLRGMPPIEAWAVLPAAIVGAAAVLAAVLATREVLAVSPLEALRSSAVDVETTVSRRRTGAVVALVLGAALLGGALLLGPVTPFAVLVGFAGGAVATVGIVGIAPVAAPPLLALAARAFGRSVPARAAAGTLATHPGRSSALVLSLFAGTAVVTMMVTAGSALTTAAHTIERDPYFQQQLRELLVGVTTVVTGIVGFAAVLGVLGFVAAMLLSVRRRTREIGLLRTLGLQRGQTRSMLLAEAGAITLVAVASGFAVGVLFGWIGAHTLLSSVVGVVSTAPSLPWQLPLAIAVAGAVVAAATSLPAGERAARIPPLAAVAAD